MTFAGTQNSRPSITLVSRITRKCYAIRRNAITKSFFAHPDQSDQCRDDRPLQSPDRPRHRQSPPSEDWGRRQLTFPVKKIHKALRVDE